MSDVDRWSNRTTVLYPGTRRPTLTKLRNSGLYRYGQVIYSRRSCYVQGRGWGSRVGESQCHIVAITGIGWFMRGAAKRVARCWL